MNLAQLGSLLKEARARSMNAEARTALEEGKALSPAYGQLVGELKRHGFTDAARCHAAPVLALPWGPPLIEEAWESVLTLIARDVCLSGPWAEQKVTHLRTQFLGTLPAWQASLEEVFTESVQSAAVWSEVFIGVVLGWTLQRREGILAARPPSDRCEPSFTFLLRKDITDGYRQDCVHGLARRVASMGVSSVEAQGLIQQLAASARVAPMASRMDTTMPGTSRSSSGTAATAGRGSSAPVVQRPATASVRDVAGPSRARPAPVASLPVRKGRVVPADTSAVPPTAPSVSPAPSVDIESSSGVALRPVHRLSSAEQWTITLCLQPAPHGPAGAVESVVALVVGGVHALPAAPPASIQAQDLRGLQRFPLGAVGVASWGGSGTPGFELAARALGLALRSLPQQRLANVHVSMDWPGQVVTRDEVSIWLDRQCRPLASHSFAWKRARVSYRAMSPQETNGQWGAALARLWTEARFGDPHANQVMRESGLGRCCLYDAHDLTALDAWLRAFDNPGLVTGDEWVSLVAATMQTDDSAFPAHALLQVADAMAEDEERPRALLRAAHEYVVLPDADPELSQQLVQWLGRHDVQLDDPALRIVQRMEQAMQGADAGSQESSALRGLVRLSDEWRERLPSLVAYADVCRAQLAIDLYDWNGAAQAVEDGLSVVSALGVQRRAALLALRAHVEACQGRLQSAMETLDHARRELCPRVAASMVSGRDVWTKRLTIWHIMATMDQPQPSVATVSALFEQAGLPLEPVAISAIAREDDAELIELHFATVRWLAFQLPDELVRAYVSARSEWSTGVGLRWAILHWYRGWMLAGRHPRAALEAWQAALALVRDVQGVGLPRMWEVVMARTLRARGVELVIPDVQLAEGAFPAQRKALQTLMDPASSFTDRAAVLSRVAVAFPFALH
ncbi:MAG: hypothetical protein KGO50_01150 [Myxococcales bacterium]|nr:hypothetical protein [Myxococcales bacterium]